MKVRVETVDQYVANSGLPFLRHRAGDYQHFNLITGIDDNENTSRLPILKCTPITVT